MVNTRTVRRGERSPVPDGRKRRERTAGDVLVVDDDQVVRGMVAWLFEDAGYHVRQAADGAEALEQLEAAAPACMVLDLMMPEVDGRTVLNRRQAEGLAPDTRIIILTAKTDHEDEVWCWEHGADEYLTKPFDGDRLIRMVAELMALTPAQLRHRRDVGLTDARRYYAVENLRSSLESPGRAGQRRR